MVVVGVLLVGLVCQAISWTGLWVVLLSIIFLLKVGIMAGIRYLLRHCTILAIKVAVGVV